MPRARFRCGRSFELESARSRSTRWTTPRTRRPWPKWNSPFGAVAQIVASPPFVSCSWRGLLGFTGTSAKGNEALGEVSISRPEPANGDNSGGFGCAAPSRVGSGVFAGPVAGRDASDVPGRRHSNPKPAGECRIEESRSLGPRPSRGDSRGPSVHGCPVFGHIFPVGSASQSCQAFGRLVRSPSPPVRTRFSSQHGAGLPNVRWRVRRDAASYRGCALKAVLSKAVLVEAVSFPPVRRCLGVYRPGCLRGFVRPRFRPRSCVSTITSTSSAIHAVSRTNG
jgi:hypothetical protein